MVITVYMTLVAPARLSVANDVADSVRCVDPLSGTRSCVAPVLGETMHSRQAPYTEVTRRFEKWGHTISD